MGTGGGPGVNDDAATVDVLMTRNVCSGCCSGGVLAAAFARAWMSTFCNAAPEAINVLPRAVSKFCRELTIIAARDGRPVCTVAKGLISCCGTYGRPAKTIT